jgi:glycosyltransferase involved in cell wall biosynthesis
MVVSGDPPALFGEFTRLIGRVSQEKLPLHYRALDISVVPTIAAVGLSRTSVDVMACGLSVVGSRLGGMPETVIDKVSGGLRVSKASRDR